MSWRLEKDVNGPVWSGTDSVFDFAWWHKELRWLLTGLVGVPFAFFTVWIATVAAWSFLSRGLADSFDLGVGAMADALAWPFLILAPTASLFAAWCAYRRLFVRQSRPSKFLTRRWTLRPTPEGLAYAAGAFSDELDASEASRDGGQWSVPLSAIARVEVAPTTQWIPSRNYRGFSIGTPRVQAVPPHEYQTFLFMADGSRRVIYTGNADFEGAAILAHSVRTWVEAQKVEALAVHTCSPREREGFLI